MAAVRECCGIYRDTDRSTIDQRTCKGRSEGKLKRSDVIGMVVGVSKEEC